LTLKILQQRNPILDGSETLVEEEMLDEIHRKPVLSQTNKQPTRKHQVEDAFTGWMKFYRTAREDLSRDVVKLLTTYITINSLRYVASV
jgi:hypothetical protein